MKHLTIEEIIEFVSADKLTEDVLKLSAAVNRHISKCAECHRIVKAYQMVYDEFSAMVSDMDFKRYVSEIAANDIKNKENDEDDIYM